MNRYDTQIKSLLGEAVEALNLGTDTDISLVHPVDVLHGDFTSNVAFTLCSQAKMAPQQVALAIVNEFTAALPHTPLASVIENVAVAGGGYINFSFFQQVLIEQFVPYASKQLEIRIPTLINKKVIIEYTDPNPFKELHIGHLYSNAVGESIARLYEVAGAQVLRVAYQGDVGMHVAKSVWGMLHILSLHSLEEGKQELEKWEGRPLSDRVQLLGKSYAAGASAYEENETAAAEMRTINFYTYRAGQEYLIESEKWVPQVPYQSFTADDEKYGLIKLVYQAGRSWSLDYFEKMYEEFGMQQKDTGKHFDEYFFESVVAEYGYKVVQEQLKNGVFEKSDGAIIFPGEKYGLHSRVFINSLGLPTYEAKELGLAPEKFRRFQYDQSIIVTGNEIAEYFKVLLKVLELIAPDLREKTAHITHGMVRLPEGKMSSRTGKVITAEWLLSEAENKITALVAENRQDTTSEERVAIAKKVSLGAIKYAFLSQNIGSDIAFDFNQSLSFQGNSGPYLQYTLVRCVSLLEKARAIKYTDAYSAKYIESLSASNSENSTYQFDSILTVLNDNDTILSKDQLRIVRNILKYNDIFDNAVTQKSPHLLCTYAYQLAQDFNSLYAKDQIVPTEGQSLRGGFAINVAISAAVRNIFYHIFYCLGIPALAKM